MGPSGRRRSSSRSSRWFPGMRSTCSCPGSTACSRGTRSRWWAWPETGRAVAAGSTRGWRPGARVPGSGAGHRVVRHVGGWRLVWRPAIRQLHADLRSGLGRRFSPGSRCRAVASPAWAWCCSSSGTRDSAIQYSTGLIPRDAPVTMGRIAYNQIFAVPPSGHRHRLAVRVRPLVVLPNAVLTEHAGPTLADLARDRCLPTGVWRQRLEHPRARANPLGRGSRRQRRRGGAVACGGTAGRRFDGIEVTEVGVRRARQSVRRRLGARDYAYGVLTDYLTERLSTEPDVDILHAQHLHSGPPTIAVGRIHRRAALVTIRDYWPVCLHGTAWWGSTNCRGCTAANLSGCMAEYWRWPRWASRIMVPWARRRLAARQREVISAQHVLAVSQAVRDRIAPRLVGARVSVVPNMVDPARVEASASSARAVSLFPSTPPPRYLLTAGKLEPTKGFDRLLPALAASGSRMPLVVAGQGALRGRLEREAEDLGLDVRFPGWIAHDELLRWQRDAHAVLFPSAWG